MPDIQSRPKKRQSRHFFERDHDGSVRLRVRFDAETASLMEEAAGRTPIMVWFHQTLEEQARAQVEQARARRPKIAPPEE